MMNSTLDHQRSIQRDYYERTAAGYDAAQLNERDETISPSISCAGHQLSIGSSRSSTSAPGQDGSLASSATMAINRR